MTFDLSIILSSLHRRLPRALVSDAAHGRLTMVASHLPPIWEWGVIECRLAQMQPQVDFMVSVGSYQEARRVVKHNLAQKAHQQNLGAAGALLECWADGADPLIARMPIMWLEYDLPVYGDGRVPAPLVFLGLDPSFFHQDDPLEPAEQRALAERGLALLNQDPSPAALDHLKRCAEHPLEVELLHVASLRPRGSDHLKIMATVAGREALLHWLTSIGWPGNPKKVHDLLSQAGEGWRTISVQLQIGETIAPYLSLELDMGTGDSLLPVGKGFCDRMIANGLCDRAKADAALAWVGHDVIDDPGLPWLFDLQRSTYFKLALLPDDTLEAKAYLGFHPSYVCIGSART